VGFFSDLMMRQKNRHELDAVGRKLDDVGESIGALAKGAGEAISNGLNAINPMSWGW